MREIVHIQAGQCGNQIGAKFWEVRRGLANAGIIFESSRRAALPRRTLLRVPSTDRICDMLKPRIRWYSPSRTNICRPCR
eukprot:scaffold103445_cov58-Attheya_sp.AAC.4